MSEATRETSDNVEERVQHYVDTLTANLPKRIRDHIAKGTLDNGDVASSIERSALNAANGWVAANAQLPEPKPQPTYVDRALAGTFVELVRERTNADGTPKKVGGNSSAGTAKTGKPVAKAAGSVEAVEATLRAWLASGQAREADVKSLVGALKTVEYTPKAPSEAVVKAREYVASLPKAQQAAAAAAMAAIVGPEFTATGREWLLRQAPAPAEVVEKPAEGGEQAAA